MPAIGKGTSFLDNQPAKLKTPMIAKYNSQVEYDGPGEENIYRTMESIPRTNGRHDANPAALKNLKFL